MSWKNDDDDKDNYWARDYELERDAKEQARRDAENGWSRSDSFRDNYGAYETHKREYDDQWRDNLYKSWEEQERERERERKNLDYDIEYRSSNSTGSAINPPEISIGAVIGLTLAAIPTLYIAYVIFRVLIWAISYQLGYR